MGEGSKKGLEVQVKVSKRKIYSWRRVTSKARYLSQNMNAGSESLDLEGCTEEGEVLDGEETQCVPPAKL